MPRSFEDRFWAKVKRGGPDDCWVWIGSLNGKRGSFRMGGAARLADVVAYEMAYGPIPKEKTVGWSLRHTCDNFRCVNAKHISLISDYEKDLSRFWKCVNKNTKNGCWLWNGSVDGSYGYFTLLGKKTLAHRFSFFVSSAGLDANVESRIFQTCGSNLCVNPAHLAKKPDTSDGRFWSLVAVGLEDECWLWLGAKGAKGYGYFGISDKDVVLAHRYSYELNVGDIPDGKMVCHKCDTRDCVNPRCLFLGDAAANSADMVSKGRSLVGETHPHRVLSDDDVVEIRKAVRLSGEKQRVLAKRFGVSQPEISRAKTGDTWGHITEEPPIPPRS